MDFLDEAVQDMNSHLYEFNKRSEVKTLVTSTQDYTLTGGNAERGAPVVPYKESLAYIEDSNNSNRINLTFMTWYLFQDRANSRAWKGEGEPSIYSFRNMNDDGKVSLFPKPSSGFNGHYLTVEYYIRIPLISLLADNNTTPYVPEEVEIPLLYNAMKRMAIHLYGPGHEDVKGFWSLEMKALNELKALDHRHPDGGTRFILSDNLKRGTRTSRDTLYIKV